MASPSKSNDKSKFRNESNQRYIRRLFLEATPGLNDKSTVLYTLRDKDYEGYPSLYRLFLEEEDPTEVNFARKYFDGFEHWQMICATTWFKPLIESWRNELDLVIRGRVYQHLRTIADDQDHKEHLSANKLLFSLPWRSKEAGKPKRGRPTQDEISGKLKEVALEERSTQEDLRRISSDYEE